MDSSAFQVVVKILAIFWSCLLDHLFAQKVLCVGHGSVDPEMEAGAGLQGAQARPWVGAVVIRRLQCLGWIQPWEFAGPAISWLPGLLLLQQTGMLYQCPL